MIKPDVIIRSNRRSLSLTISKQGELIVKAPKKLPLEYILSFIGQKEKWIASKQNQIISINKHNEDLLSHNKFMFLGQLYSKTHISKLKEVELTDGELLFPECSDNFKTVSYALKWYKTMTAEILKNRLPYFANIMQLNYESVTLTNAKSRWGSCDSGGKLKFNLRLAMLPHKVIDYIIIHELTHLIEFNHSKNFYKIIESIMPDYNRYRTELKANNFLLQLLR